jgi:hypothetical protein
VIACIPWTFGQPENIRPLLQSTFLWSRLCDLVCFSEFSVYYQVCRETLCWFTEALEPPIGSIACFSYNRLQFTHFFIESKLIFRCQINVIKAWCWTLLQHTSFASFQAKLAILSWCSQQDCFSCLLPERLIVHRITQAFHAGGAKSLQACQPTSHSTSRASQLRLQQSCTTCFNPICYNCASSFMSLCESLVIRGGLGQLIIRLAC